MIDQATLEQRIQTLEQQLRFQQGQVEHHREGLRNARTMCAQLDGAIAALRGVIQLAQQPVAPATNGAEPPKEAQP